MIIAKVMQNLANNIFFAKEAHMVCLNEFLKANITNVTRFLSEVNVNNLSICVNETNSSFFRRNTPQQPLTRMVVNGWAPLLTTLTR